MGRIYNNQELFLGHEDLADLSARVRAAEDRLRLSSKCEDGCAGREGFHNRPPWEMTGVVFELNGREHTARIVDDQKAKDGWRLGLFIESIPIVEG